MKDGTKEGIPEKLVRSTGSKPKSTIASTDRFNSKMRKLQTNSKYITCLVVMGDVRNRKKAFNFTVLVKPAKAQETQLLNVDKSSADS